MTAAADRRARRRDAATWAGFRSARFARQNGRLIVVVNNDEAGLDGSGPRSCSTICDYHGTVIQHDTRQLAEWHASDPEGWCEQCHAERAAARHTSIVRL